MTAKIVILVRLSQLPQDWGTLFGNFKNYVK